jgi:hypothetical protein
MIYSHYDEQDIMVMQMVGRYLSESTLCKDDDYRPKGGLFIKDQRLPVNDDMVEVNLLGKLMFFGDNVTALINTNIYNQYPYRTKELSKVMKKVLIGAVINGFNFGFEREWYDPSGKRKMHNLLFIGTIPKSDFQILIDSYF